MKSETVKTAIRQYLESNQENLIRFTSELCAFATENPPGRNYKPCVDFLREYSESMGLETQTITIPLEYQRLHNPPETFDYPRMNLLVRWDTGSNRTLHFNSHFDVVPTSDKWETDPYCPVVKDGRLYGRGTCDMKGCLAASLFAVQALRANAIAPSWNIELSFTADEEIGGECGVGYLVKNQWIKPDAAVVCEGGMGDRIAYGHRGVLWMDVLVEGASGHGSNPVSGANAFEKGVELARRIMELQQAHKKRRSRYTIQPPSCRTPTMSLGGLSGGGNKVNTIPDRFHFTIDRRLIPEEDVDEVQNEIQTVISEVIGKDESFRGTLNVIKGFNAGMTEPDSDICQIAKDAVESVTGKEAALEIFSAFTDLHFFTNEGHCPTVGYGVEGDGLHSSDEYVMIHSLVETARVYAEMMI